jgi:uncharacterized protein (DUF983 family)
MATTVEGPVRSHDNDWTSAETAAGRNVGLSLWRGVRGRCPPCGRDRLFFAFSQSRGPLLCLPPRFHRPPSRRPAGLLSDRYRRTRHGSGKIEVDYASSLAFQLGVYLPIRALASIALLQPVKGAVVALEWALGMHGFGAHPVDKLQD